MWCLKLTESDLLFDQWSKFIDDHWTCIFDKTKDFIEKVKDMELTDKEKDAIASVIGDLLSSIEYLESGLFG